MRVCQQKEVEAVAERGRGASRTLPWKLAAVDRSSDAACTIQTHTHTVAHTENILSKREFVIISNDSKERGKEEVCRRPVSSRCDI